MYDEIDLDNDKWRQKLIHRNRPIQRVKVRWWALKRKNLRAWLMWGALGGALGGYGLVRLIGYLVGVVNG